MLFYEIKLHIVWINSFIIFEIYNPTHMECNQFIPKLENQHRKLKISFFGFELGREIFNIFIITP